MYTCGPCGKVFCKFRELIVHFRCIHNYGEANFPATICPKQSCSTQICTWSGLLRHFKSHEIVLDSENYDKNFEENLTPSLNLVDPVLDDVGNDPNLTEFNEQADITTNLGINVMKDILISFCSSLLASGVTNSTVDFVVKEFENSFLQISKLILRISNKFCKENFEDFSCQSLSLIEAFSHVNSIYKRQKALEKYSQIIMPKEYSLGSRLEQRVRDNKRQEVIVSDTFMYVPILKSLEKLVSSPDIYQCFSKVVPSNSNSIESFKDTVAFKTNCLFSRNPNSIQIQLFYDDFETVNPLGSKRGIHKLGAFYFTIKNLPDYINSQLSSIHLLALFYSEDAKKYGINSILKLIIPDFLYLEKVGISVNGSDRIFGTLCSLAFDNLGGNSLLGFNESFNSHYFCRICCTSKSEAQEIFEHSKMIVRDKSNYANHLSDKSFGVQTECILNQLNYFNFLDSPSVDIMHDLLEGVVPYEIKLVLQKLISLKCFDLDLINQRIQAHNFGYLESKNRPSPIRLEGSGNKIGQKASQAWCLIRYLPVIIGDLVISNEQKKYWEILLQLLEILSYVFCRKFSESTLLLLDAKIVSHHNLFRKLFPDQKLIPKHHLMCHYSFVIRQSGPLVSMWAMRYEGKHNYFSQLAGQIRNFRNICSSLAKRHQQYSSHLLKTIEINEGVRADNIVVSNLYEFAESFDLIEKLRQFDIFKECDGNTKVYTANKVWYRNYKYKIDYVVCYGMGNIFPNFGVIQDLILIDETRCLLFLKKLNVDFFDRHYFSYIVTRTNDLFEVVDISNLIVHECFEFQKNCNTDAFHLVLRHYL